MEDREEEETKPKAPEEDGGDKGFDQVKKLLNQDTSSKDMPDSIKRLMERQKDNDRRIEKTIKKTKTNPKWFVPVFVLFLAIGLAWVVVNYVTAGQYPVPVIGNWNLLIGFGLMFIGFIMTMWWK